MEILKSLPDDQLALLGCVVALFSTGGLMSLSYFLGRGRLSASRTAIPAVVQRASRVKATQASEPRRRTAA